MTEATARRKKAPKAPETTEQMQARRTAAIEALRPAGAELRQLLKAHPRTRLGDGEGLAALRHWVVERALAADGKAGRPDLTYGDLMGDPHYAPRPSQNEPGRKEIMRLVNEAAGALAASVRSELIRRGFRAERLTAGTVRTTVRAVL